MHRTGHSRKFLCLRWPLFWHLNTYTHTQPHHNTRTLTQRHYPFPLESVSLQSILVFDLTKIKYVCLSSFPSLLNFLLFSWIPSFCGYFFFCQSKVLKFKYYYAVALISGAKKRNAVIARSFFSSLPAFSLLSFLQFFLSLPSFFSSSVISLILFPLSWSLLPCFTLPMFPVLFLSRMRNCVLPDYYIRSDLLPLILIPFFSSFHVIVICSHNIHQKHPVS